MPCRWPKIAALTHNGCLNSRKPNYITRFSLRLEPEIFATFGSRFNQIKSQNHRTMSTLPVQNRWKRHTSTSKFSHFNRRYTSMCIVWLKRSSLKTMEIASCLMKEGEFQFVCHYSLPPERRNWLEINCICLEPWSPPPPIK